MNIIDAIKTLDEVIPDPDNKMVDQDHLAIAIAWKRIKEALQGEKDGAKDGEEKKADI